MPRNPKRRVSDTPGSIEEIDRVVMIESHIDKGCKESCGATLNGFEEHVNHHLDAHGYVMLQSITDTVLGPEGRYQVMTVLLGRRRRSR